MRFVGKCEKRTWYIWFEHTCNSLLLHYVNTSHEEMEACSGSTCRYMPKVFLHNITLCSNQRVSYYNITRSCKTFALWTHKPSLKTPLVPQQASPGCVRVCFPPLTCPHFSSYTAPFALTLPILAQTQLFHMWNTHTHGHTYTACQLPCCCKQMTGGLRMKKR